MSPSARGFQFFYYILYLSIGQISQLGDTFYFFNFFIFTGVMRKEKGGKRGKKKLEERTEERTEERIEEKTEEREERIEDTEEGLEVTEEACEEDERCEKKQSATQQRREPGSVLHSVTAKKKMPL